MINSTSKFLFSKEIKSFLVKGFYLDFVKKVKSNLNHCWKNLVMVKKKKIKQNVPWYWNFLWTRVLACIIFIKYLLIMNWLFLLTSFLFSLASFSTNMSICYFLVFCRKGTRANFVWNWLLWKGSFKKYLIRKMAFLDLLSPMSHVVNFFSPITLLCHSLKSDKLWFETEKEDHELSYPFLRDFFNYLERLYVN